MRLKEKKKYTSLESLFAFWVLSFLSFVVFSKTPCPTFSLETFYFPSI